MSNAIAPLPQYDAHVRDRDHERAFPRIAPPELWRVARWFLQWMFSLFGEPSDIARRPLLALKQHQQLRSWLACAEAMLRCLLVLEASAYAKPNTPSRQSAPRRRGGAPLGHWPAKPEDWRVSFRVLHSSTLRRAQRDAEGAAAGSIRVSLSLPKAKRQGRVSRQDRWSTERFDPPKFRDAWPLARRFEACLRVFSNPAPFAKRLARRLHAAPHRHAEALRAPPEAVHRVDRFAEMRECAAAPWRERRSSA